MSAGFSHNINIVNLLAFISSTGTLVDVLVGGWLTSHNQKRERQTSFFRQQLGEFYGPMLAMRAEVLAKSELRLKISGAAGAALQGLVADARRGGGIGRIGVKRSPRNSRHGPVRSTPAHGAITGPQAEGRSFLTVSPE
jgi:hypothetical protein